MIHLNLIKGGLYYEKNTKISIFTGLIVAIVVFILLNIAPDMNSLILAVIAGLSAIIGWIIGNKLFKNKY